MKYIKFILAAAAVALLVPLGVAGAAAVIDGGDVRNSSLTGKDVKNKSLTKKDIKGQLRGPRGLQGPAGPAGQSGLSGVPGANGAAGGTVSAALRPSDRRFSILAVDNEADGQAFVSVNSDGNILVGANSNVSSVAYVGAGHYRVVFTEAVYQDSLTASIRDATPGTITVTPDLRPDNPAGDANVAVVRTFG